VKKTNFNHSSSSSCIEV